MDRIWRKIIAFALCGTMAVSIALAGQKNKNEDKNRGKARDARVTVDIFLGNDRDMILHHFRVNRGNLPPGKSGTSHTFPYYYAQFPITIFKNMRQILRA